MILLPDATGSTSIHWITVGVGLTDPDEALVNDNGNGSYVKCDNNLAYMVIEYADPSVAEADIDFNETVSVRFLSSGKAIHRLSSSVVSIDYQVPSGNPAQLCSYDAHRTNYETINGIARTTKDGTHDWDYAALQSLEMICIKNGTVEVYLSYLALEVTYTEAVTTNATFFGANF